MKVTKTKAGHSRYGPFSTENTLCSYLRMYTPPVMVVTKRKRWTVGSHESIGAVARRWKRSTKNSAYIEIVPGNGEFGNRKVIKDEPLR